MVPGETAQDFTGRTLGNWLIQRRLGEGAFGAVYEAQNVAISGRRAAVKVLHPHMSLLHEVKLRFLNEASAASRAEHDNIVQIFDGGITPDGVCYSVMELLRGYPLSHLIHQGPLDVLRTIHLGLQIAGGLEAAHQIGVVHRDLKPDNVFITQRPARPDFVKIVDFGVAKLRGEGQETPHTSIGMLIGTPGYMSPEQWMTLPDIDGRADIYALGVILFECLSGALPFKGHTPYEWQTAHLTQPIDPALIAGRSREMALLITSMLAKKREERPTTMFDVTRQLKSIQGRLLKAQRTALGETFDVRDHPLPAPLAAGAPTPTPLPAPASPPAAQLSGARGSLIARTPSIALWLLAACVFCAAAIGAGALWRWQSRTVVERTPIVVPAAVDAATPAPPRPLPLPDELVAFNAGVYIVGAGSQAQVNGPPHRVHLHRFAIGKYEVSMDEYRRFAEAIHLGGELPWDGVDDFATIRNLPVNFVSQVEARRYCAWKYAHGRLPSEEEWEVAARDASDEERRFPWHGDRFDSNRTNAATRDQRAELVPVDDLPAGATARGLQHLVGNVAEWTSSAALAYPGSSALPPPGMAVIRGGAANDTDVDDLTVSARRFRSAATRDPFIGFRCAVSLDPKTAPDAGDVRYPR